MMNGTAPRGNYVIYIDFLVTLPKEFHKNDHAERAKWPSRPPKADFDHP